MALVLAMLLALRLVAAPAILSSSEPGVIAICSGTKITYISLNGEAPKEGEHRTTECPFFGVTAVVMGAETYVDAPVYLTLAPAPAPTEIIWHTPRLVRAYLSRAPPRTL